MGPKPGLDGCRKFRPPPGFDPRTVQLVERRYTDWFEYNINIIFSTVRKLYPTSEI
jgi:hypothetical protein